MHHQQDGIIEMPKETKNITLFNAGLITNPDINDIPDNAFSSGSVNIKTNAQGKLQPVKDIYEMSNDDLDYGVAVYRNGFIKRTDGKYDLVYNDGTNIDVIQDYYGAVTNALVVASKSFMTSTPKNEGLHIGTGNGLSNAPWWVGWIRHQQFNDIYSTPGTDIDFLYNVSDEIKIPSSSSVTAIARNSESGTGTFTTYEQIGVSYEYDGYMESPISRVGVLTMAGTPSSVNVTITFSNFATVNRRITKLHIWMRPIAGATPTTSDGNLFRLHKEIDINDVGWTTSGANKQITLDIPDNPGESYEAYTGISQEVDSTVAYYKLSTELNEHLFVADAITYYHPNNPYMLFRSKEGQYSVFDSTTDFMRLPEIPNALISHNGKIIALSNNAIYRINFNLFIEDITEGIGCLNNNSVISTEYGLFFADKKGAYRLTNNVEKISNPIQDKFFASTTHVRFDSANEMVLFTQSNDIWGYNVITGEWMYYENYLPTTITGSITGKDGEVYFAESDTPGIWKLFSSTNKSYTAISKEFDFEDPSQEKRFYKLVVDYSGTAPTVQYSTNGGSSFTTLTASSAGIYELKSGGDWINAKTIMFKFSGTATINSYSVIFRRFIGRSHE